LLTQKGKGPSEKKDLLAKNSQMQGGKAGQFSDGAFGKKGATLLVRRGWGKGGKAFDLKGRGGRAAGAAHQKKT